MEAPKQVSGSESLRVSAGPNCFSSVAVKVDTLINRRDYQSGPASLKSGVPINSTPYYLAGIQTDDRITSKKRSLLIISDNFRLFCKRLKELWADRTSQNVVEENAVFGLLLED